MRHVRDPRRATVNPVVVHTLFEILAYAVGVRLYLALQRRRPTPSLVDPTARLAVMAGAIVGAVIGAKLAYWLEDPAAAFAGFPDARALMAGKSIVGALLGGLAGVELMKAARGLRESTGDGFVWPLAAGIAIGRIGCHLAGLGDHTAGLPSTMPWAVDYGDGVPRHPTALYEIPVVLLVALLLQRWRAPRDGDRFRAFMVAYLAWRLVIEWLKPMPWVYFHALSGLQLLCIAGIGYYSRDIVRWARASGRNVWARS